MLSLSDAALPTWQARDAVRRDDQRTKALFTRARQVETKYSAALRQIARHVGQIIRGFPAGDPAALPELNATLSRYSEILGPWARHTAKRVLQEVARWDEVAWNQHAKEMSLGIREALRSVNINQAFKELEAEQIALIQSIPVVAAQRVNKLTTEALASGSRPADLVQEIMKSGHVARSHAELIAVTEVARASSKFTQARAEHIGSTHYVWETTKDRRVRKVHQGLQGKVIAWADPPVASEKGERAHAGQIYRCFTGETEAAALGDLRSLFRAPYSGPLVKLSTQDTFFEATPNHPILTTLGWRTPAEIQVGDELLAMPSDCPDSVKDKKNKWPAMFENKFSSPPFGFSRVRELGSEFDFYGDVVGNDVDTIRADNLLGGAFVVNLSDERRNYQEAGSELVVIPDGGFSILLKALELALTHTGRHRASFLNSHSAHAYKPRCTDPAYLNSSFDKTLPDSRSQAAIFFGQRQFAGASTVAVADNFVWESRPIWGGSPAVLDGNSARAEFFAEKIGADIDLLGGIFEHDAALYKRLRVVDKSVRDYFGHVYTMETSSGTFTITGSGIICKNCRCWSRPILEI